MGRGTSRWKTAWWILSAVFVLTAALNLLHVRAGFLTSHAADLCVPAWLYIHLRGLGGKPPRMPWLRFLGRTPERAAAFLFLASAGTEISQRFWPGGPFSGTFDPLDLVAYAAGLLACYVPDRFVAGSSPGDRTMRELERT